MSADAPLRKAIPLAQSILWSPTATPGTGGGGRGGGRPGNIPFPVFLAQSALAAVREHLATAPPSGQGILGFLVGDLCECPDSNVSYLIIDAALRLSQPIYGDRTTDVVTRLWDRIVAQVEETKGHLIGWYHTHAPLPVSMTAHDIETHEHYFAEPWQVALVLGSDPDGQPVAGLFRAGADEAWATTVLPFYELLSEESFRPDGVSRHPSRCLLLPSSRPSSSRGRERGRGTGSNRWNRCPSQQSRSSPRRRCVPPKGGAGGGAPDGDDGVAGVSCWASC